MKYLEHQAIMYKENKTEHPLLTAYIEDFTKAVSRSFCRLSFRKPRIRSANITVTNNHLTEYLAEYLRIKEYPNLEVSAGQCIKWCYFLENIVEVALSMKGWITIGQLWDGNKYLFAPSQNDIVSWCENGIHLSDMSTDGMNVHAWLTMENGTIVDLTLLSTMATVKGDNWLKYNGHVLIGYKNNLFPNHRYIPMLVGNKVISSIHSKSSVPFLATSTAELFPISVLVEES